MQYLTKEIVQALPDNSIIPIALSNGVGCTIALLWKEETGTDISLYLVECEQQSGKSLYNEMLLDINSNAISYNELASMDGTACTSDNIFITDLLEYLDYIAEITQLSADDNALVNQNSTISGITVSTFLNKEALYIAEI